MADSILCLREPFEHEIDPIKGSRFLACLAPVATEQQAKAFIEATRLRFKDARHHCFAWRLGEKGEPWRCSDDGEPSGSAGRPILMQLEGHEVSDLVCVVVRWFGGTKLGVGGLVRAYGAAAGKALDRAPIEERPITVLLRVACPFACQGAIQGVLRAHGLEPREARFCEGVELLLAVPRVLAEDLKRDLLERSAGRALVQILPS